MRVETVEEFVCPDCNGTNYLEWRGDEAERAVSCVHCCHPKVVPEAPEVVEAKTAEAAAHGRQYISRGVEQPATTGRFVAIKGAGRTLQRDAVTKRELPAV